MNYNQSLDDIIKFSRSKNPDKKNSRSRRSGSKPRSRQLKQKKNEKNSFPTSVKKSNTTSFKPKMRKKRNKKLPVIDARLKISGVADARLKILQNKKRLGLNSTHRSPLVMSRSNIMDARLKIEAHKQKKLAKPEPRSRSFGITRLAPDGIIERRISANSFNDNGVHVEYEDEDMNLEYEGLKKEDWADNSFTLRRTIHNLQKKRSALKASSMHDNRTDSPLSFYHESEDDNMPLKEVTRTISNASIKKQPLNTARRSYSKRMSPVRQFSYDDDQEMRHSSRSSPPHPSPMSREPAYHLIMISNLHENVTGEDIKELFEDVGDLVYTKMIRNGMAEVAYKSQKDAMKAVEIYHNRQLDGLPMKCTLLSSSSESSSSRYIPPVNTFSSVAPDTRIIKKALFSGR